MTTTSPDNETDVETLIRTYIQETGMARLTQTTDGQPAVLFLDEDELVPLADLAYSDELGFYRKSLFEKK